jgi:3-phenylpropionate/trans-cinnamate dioxygenase ferredoxin subunit
MNFEMNGNYIKICSLKDLSECEGKKFIIEGNDIAIFKVGGEVFALSNRCPHQQNAQIFDGFIEEGFVVCPAHGWKFNLRTGRTHKGGSGLIRYETKIQEGQVYIKYKGNEWAW